MKKIPFLFYLLILFSSTLYSQGVLFDHINSDKTPKPSTFPEYSFFGENLSRGHLDISIPLYEISSGNIKLPITLTYNSGGIKIDQVASNVGLGWNLIAGGVVQRKIQDIEDHELLRLYSNGDILLKTIGYHMEAEDILQPNSTTPVYTDVAKIDGAPDLFSAMAPGISSKFYLESLDRGSNPNDFQNNVSTYTTKFLNGDAKKGGIVTRKRLTGLLSNGFNVNEIQGFPYSTHGVSGQFLYGHTPMDYEEFVLTNSQGLIYTFDKPGFTESISSFSSVAQFTAESDVWGNLASISSNSTLLSAFAAGLYRLRANSWNLTNINDPTTSNSVSFSYESYNKSDIIEFSTNIDNKKYASGNNPDFGCSMEYIPSYSFNYSLNSTDFRHCPNCELLVKTPKYYLKSPQVNRIDEINWNQGVVKFYYELERLDELNEHALTKVEVLDTKGKKIKTYFFNYSYFISKENCNDWKCKRLRLDGIDILEGNERKEYYSLDYYDDIPLPKVNSLEKDFLGYYNNNGAEIGNSLSTLKTPTLYYVPGLGKNSVLPFPRNSSLEIDGDYSLLPNEYSLTGLLKEFINPLGGSNQFEYENHKFNMYGENMYGPVFTAGGARIKTQILNDGNNERIINYEYESGRLINVPVYGYSHAFKEFSATDSERSAFISYTSKQNGGDSWVEYGRVIKKEIGVGYTQYLFSNEPNIEVIPQNTENCFSHFYDNSAFGKTSYFEDNTIFRSKITKEKVFDNNHKILKQTSYFYTDEELENLPLSFQNSHTNSSCCTTDDHTSTSTAVHDYATLSYTSNLKIQRNLLTQKSIIEYLEGGLKVTQENFTYDNQYPLIKEHRVFDNVTELETNYYYPFDSEVSTIPYMSTLVNQNRISEPVIQVSKKDDIQTSKSQLNYDNFNGKVLLKSNSIAKGFNILEEESIIDIRDDKGNILQYHNRDGVNTAILYGYNRGLPIAKIVNAAYDQVSSYVSVIQNISDNDNSNCLQTSSCNETDMRSEFNTMRTNLPNAQITSYTYDPLIGVTSITDPRGNTVYYQYDGFNRLKSIKNVQGKLIKDYKYQLKN